MTVDPKALAQKIKARMAKRTADEGRRTAVAPADPKVLAQKIKARMKGAGEGQQTARQDPTSVSLQGFLTSGRWLHGPWWTTMSHAGPPPTWGGTTQYMDIIRSPDDPEREGRETRKGKETAWREDAKKGTVASWKKKIESLLSDDKPRTFNAIGVELTGYTADVLMESPLRDALWELVAEWKVAHTHDRAIRFAWIKEFGSKGVVRRRARSPEAMSSLWTLTLYTIGRNHDYREMLAGLQDLFGTLGTEDSVEVLATDHTGGVHRQGWPHPRRRLFLELGVDEGVEVALRAALEGWVSSRPDIDDWTLEASE